MDIQMDADFLCRKALAKAQTITITITGSVGLNGANRDPEVRKIQEALNRVPLVQGGLADPEKLKVDGLVGSKTTGAIRRFQLKQVGPAGADSRIDPGKTTLNKLNQVLSSSSPTLDPVADAPLLKKFLEGFGLAAIGIRSAHLNASRALSVVDQGGNSRGLGGSRAELMDRVDRHFRIDRMPSAQRRAELQRVQGVLGQLQEVLLLPADGLGSFGGLGKGAFDLDTSGAPLIAFATANGFRSTELNSFGRPANRIYIGKRGYAEVENKDLAAFILVHEMTHFVGHRGNKIINDFVRGWFTDEAMKILDTVRSVENADCYAGFVHECRTGSSARPSFLPPARAGGLGGAR